MRRTLALAAREVRSYFSLPIAYVVVPAYLLLANVHLFILEPFFVVGRATIRPMFEFAPFLFTLFVPAISMRALAEERRAGTLEVLLSWPVSDWQVVLGKFLGAWALLAISVLLTLPAPLSVAALGPLDWGPVVGGYIGLILLGGAYLALGLLASAVTRNQIIAFILGFSACFTFFVIGRAGALAPPEWSWLFEAVGFEARFSRIARGVLDSRDLVFFASATLGALALTVEVLHSRRWR